MQAGGNADELMEKSKEVKKKIVEMEEKEKEVIKARDGLVVAIGNLVHDSVPVSDNEVRLVVSGLNCCHGCLWQTACAHLHLPSWVVTCFGG